MWKIRFDIVDMEGIADSTESKPGKLLGCGKMEVQPKQCFQDFWLWLESVTSGSNPQGRKPSMERKETEKKIFKIVLTKKKKKITE